MYHSTKNNTTRRHIDNLQNELSQLEPDSTYIKDITDFISGKTYNQDKLTKMWNNKEHQTNSVTDENTNNISIGETKTTTSKQIKNIQFGDDIQ